MGKLFRFGLVILVALLLAGAVACGGAAPSAAPPPASDFTDHAGRTVKFAGPPQKIVSLAPSNTEILFALGLADRVVGVTDFDDYPPEAKLKKSIGGYSTPNIEEIVALAPDMVLATRIHLPKILPQLEARGITAVVLDPKTVEQVMDSISLVAKITGSEKQASALVTSLRKRVRAVTNKTEKLAENQRPGTFYVVWHEPLMTAGKGTLQDELIRLAGGRNIAADLADYVSISLETVLAGDPGVIIAGESMGPTEGKIFRSISEDGRLAVTAARRSGKVFAIDGNLVSRPGPRIVDGLEGFLAFIHPELKN